MRTVQHSQLNQPEKKIPECFSRLQTDTASNKLSQSQGQADLNVQPKQLCRNNMDSFNDHTKQHGTGEEFSNTKVKNKTLNQNGGYIFVA